MILEAVVFALVALILLALLLLLLREPARPTAEAPPRPQLPQVEALLPLNCRHFPQLRQVLGRTDAEFMRRRATPQLERRWRRERRHVAQEFLKGLREDFARLAGLARAVAALSPQVSQQQEAKLFWLGLRFRVLFSLVQLRLLLGPVPLGALNRLAGMITRLAEQIEAGMLTLEETSLARLRAQQSGFSD